MFSPQMKANKRKLVFTSCKVGPETLQIELSRAGSLSGL
jgi:hypothetical protein